MSSTKFAAVVLISVLVAMLDSGAAAAELPPIASHPKMPVSYTGCGTGDHLDDRLHRLNQWTKGRRPRGPMTRAAESHGSDIRFEKGVFVMRTNTAVAPFDRPFDLHNSTLLFTRTGAASFDVQKTALDYDGAVGTQRRTFTGNQSESYSITNFAFPFYASSVSNIVITSTKGIFLSAPPNQPAYQLGIAEAFAPRVSVIAPLLDSANADGLYNLFVKETASSLTITWRTRVLYEFNEDIQVTLFSNGNIRMSYKTVNNLSHGSIIVSSGQESFYSAPVALTTILDPNNDAAAALPAGLKDMLDIVSVAINRVSNTDLIEVVITTTAAINQAAIPAGQYLQYEIRPGATSNERFANSLLVRIDSTGVSYAPGTAWYFETATPPATIAGNTVVLYAADEHFAFASTAAPLTVTANSWLYTGSFTTADSANGSASFAPSATPAQTDLSTLTSVAAISNKPIVEAFTLPIIDVFAVWDRLKAVPEWSLTDANVDQVAIYQSFYTDLIFYAGGFSTNSNPQVDGIAHGRSGYGTASPKRASLLHMDKLGRGWNGDPEGILSLLAHEFGHRWLYYFRIREGAADNYSLNPDRAHPKRGAHLPAAFNVITAQDTSTMGGGFFSEVGPLSYRSSSTPGYYGYTWHELYLMGLADAAEVTAPWFYLNHPNLESAYYPASNFTFNVSAKTDVQQSQITTSMGARNPTAATSQKIFNTIFVVLERASSPLTATEIAAFSSGYRSPFKSHFAAATGGRGSIVTAPSTVPAEADFTFSPPSPASGAVVTFTDRSWGEPASWAWAFGDGATSTAQHPTHTYSAGGTFNVTLTVTKPGATPSTSSITKSVTVAGATTQHSEMHGDFDGDGRDDILLVDQTGAIAIWLMNGTTITSGASPGSIGAFTVVGIGDLNGDGRSDIVLQDPSGNVGCWIMNGTALTSGHLIGSPGAYSVAGVADFTGDGRADILLRDSLGNLGLWMMNGHVIAGGGFVGSPGAYTVAGVADFTADGRADILLRDSLGNLGMWIMNGATVAAGGFVGSPGAYSVVATADLEANGRADIILRDSLGNIGAWFMNGSALTGGALIGSPGGYLVNSAGDYSGDNRADLLLRESTTGAIGMWLMNGSTISAGGFVAAPGINYIVH